MVTLRNVALVLLLLLVLIAVMFTVQNNARTTDLSLSLYWAGFHLRQPAPVPVLLWIAFAAGLAVGGGWGIQQRMAAGRRVREMQQRMARSDAGWK